MSKMRPISQRRSKLKRKGLLGAAKKLKRSRAAVRDSKPSNGRQLDVDDSVLIQVATEHISKLNSEITDLRGRVQAAIERMDDRDREIGVG